MPKLRQTVTPAPEVTTVAEVELSPALKKKVQVAVDLYKDLVQQRKDIEKRIKKALVAIETPFHDADESELLTNGVRVGEVPVKLITGKTSKSLNKEKLMKKYKITPAGMASCTDEKPKKDYLYVGLPKGDDDEGEE